MTWRSARELKIFSASSTATEPTEMLPALDVGLGADVFGDVEGLLERLVEAAAGMAVPEGEVVGLFQLAEDFRFRRGPWNRGRRRL